MGDASEARGVRGAQQKWLPVVQCSEGSEGRL